MTVTPGAMKRILADPYLKKMLMSGRVDEIGERPGFLFYGKTLSLSKEGGHGVGLINHRTIKGDVKQISERFSDCEREILQYGTRFVRCMLSSHRAMVESRTDWTPEQKTGYRKLLIATWHNTKIVHNIRVNENAT